MAYPWTQSLIITLPKKGNLQLCQNYRTINLINHSSKAMLKVILNRLKPQAEEIIAEEQAGLKAGKSTTEQTFNLRILCEKYLQHQQNLFHVFIDFKKAFDRVWQATLWANMPKYNINASLVRTIEQLHDKATSAVQMNGSIGEWFRTKWQKLGTATSFKYLGTVVSDDGFTPEILSRIEKATAAFTKLKPIWRDNNVFLGSKVKLMRSLSFPYFCMPVNHRP